MQRQGLIHIYYGDGKGKTTAAMGQVVRAAGQGFKVLVYQFLKDNSSGERKVLEQTDNITCMKGSDSIKFSFRMTEEEKDAQREFCKGKLKEIRKIAEEYDMVLLDEVICAVGTGFLTEEELAEFLENKPPHTEMILTGNPPGERLIGLADYVTEMKKRKHPFDRGLSARTGIER